MITLTRDPARISRSGTFPVPGFPGATYVVGNDAVMDFDHSSLPSEIACDAETAGLSARARLDVKSIQIGDSHRAIIFDPRVPEQFGRIREIVNSGRKLVFHNSPFDVPLMSMIGLIDLDTIELITDTLIWARLANPDEKLPKKLQFAANRHLGLKMEDPLKAILKVLGWSKERWYSEGDLNIPNYRNMAAADIILTHRLRPVVESDAFARITENHPYVEFGVSGQEAADLLVREQILNRETLRRTCIGIRADLEFLDNYRSEHGPVLASQVSELENNGITPGYAKSLTTWLAEHGEIPEDYPETAKTHQPSGKADDLLMLDHPLAKLFVAHKQADKIEKDYLSKIAEFTDSNGRIHPAFNYLLAATGRGSMDAPPVHQLPEGARGMLIPDNYEEALGQRATHELIRNSFGKVTKEVCHCKNPKGFASIDWSQIEPCLAANVAKDHKVIQGYESGESDLYTDIASFAGIGRKQTKKIVLGSLYGEGLLKLARDPDLNLITGAEALKIRSEQRKRNRLEKQKPEGERRFVSQVVLAHEYGIEGLIKADELRNRVFGAMSETTNLINTLKGLAKDHKMLFTLSGRILPIPSSWYDGEYTVETHKGVNYFCQGGAYDILADTLLRIIKAGLGSAVYFSMHDELIVDWEAAHDIRKIMETPPERLCLLAERVPVLKTDLFHFGERWGVDP